MVIDYLLIDYLLIDRMILTRIVFVEAWWFYIGMIELFGKRPVEESS